MSQSSELQMLSLPIVLPPLRQMRSQTDPTAAGSQRLGGCTLSVGVPQRARAGAVNAGPLSNSMGPRNPLDDPNFLSQARFGPPLHSELSPVIKNSELATAIESAKDDLDDVLSAEWASPPGTRPEEVHQFRQIISEVRLNVLGRKLDTKTGLTERVKDGELDALKSVDDVQNAISDVRSLINDLRMSIQVIDSQRQALASCRIEKQSADATAVVEIKQILMTSFKFTESNADKFLKNTTIPHHDNPQVLKRELQELAHKPELVTDVSQKYKDMRGGSVLRQLNNNALKVDNLRELLTARQDARSALTLKHVSDDAGITSLMRGLDADQLKSFGVPEVRSQGIDPQEISVLQDFHNRFAEVKPEEPGAGAGLGEIDHLPALPPVDVVNERVDQRVLANNKQERIDGEPSYSDRERDNSIDSLTEYEDSIEMDDDSIEELFGNFDPRLSVADSVDGIFDPIEPDTTANDPSTTTQGIPTNG